MSKREISVRFDGTDYLVIVKDNHLREKKLRSQIGDGAMGLGCLELQESLEFGAPIRVIDNGLIYVGKGSTFFVKDHWLQEPSASYFALEEVVQGMVTSLKSQKARRSAPSAWTRSIGFSCRLLFSTGYTMRAPYTPQQGISAAALRKDEDKRVFQLVTKILQKDFCTFAGIFSQSGRIDIKYNSSIKQADRHFDRKDVCHQVYFTLGNSDECLYVDEIQGVVELSGQKKPTAFDGRFQHWVGLPCGRPSDQDRISFLCYLTDVPLRYKHGRMTVLDLKTYTKQ
jgi:hypothetical protein